jgi:uncharacterized UPF0146 family protein
MFDTDDYFQKELKVYEQVKYIYNAKPSKEEILQIKARELKQKLDKILDEWYNFSRGKI